MTFDPAGFEGFVPFAQLPTGNVPAEPGVYLVTRPGTAPPTFLDASPAGWCKGKDPSVPLAELESSWVQDEPVVYIGKASAGAAGKRGLRKRLDEYRRHGTGQRAAHWGGRLIWQLADSAELLVSWRIEQDARQLERAMIQAFVSVHGKRPFANRTG